ncbi:dienelactone hydrolase family protein [Marinobacter sp. C2H3]|uniref:dienelactone hydrolase family protein n=1 Tax=Marinobacter sp. C2H3 TaxID=3119003 RepID=UPI00300EF06E
MSDVQTQWIEIASDGGKTFSGYLALPPAGSGPGLVLIQEIWGVNRHIRAVAEQYALDGYVVLAPDVFWRQEERVDLDYDEDGTAKAFRMMQAADVEQSGLDMAQAVDRLRARPEVTGKVAAMGYCMGGRLAFRAAASGKPDAAVCYYGGGIQNSLELAPQVTAPILFHFAGLDKHIPPEAVASVRGAFADHREATIHEYPNADHGFNCWARPAYHQPSSALAHGRTLEFLARHLG